MRLTMSVAILTIATVMLATACNTMEGVGEDIRAAGHALDKDLSREQQQAPIVHRLSKIYPSIIGWVVIKHEKQYIDEYVCCP